jgi:hypothetical protein
MKVYDLILAGLFIRARSSFFFGRKEGCVLEVRICKKKLGVGGGRSPFWYHYIYLHIYLAIICICTLELVHQEQHEKGSPFEAIFLSLCLLL